MRNIIIGIVIGLVCGVMAGATVVAPSLEQARLAQAPQTTAKDRAEALGAEDLNIAADETDAVAALKLTPASELRLVSLFRIKVPVLGALPNRLKQALPAATGGRLGVTLYDPGALVDAGDTFEALKSGAIDAVFAPPGQWDAQDPELQLFTAIPFGPGANEHLAWYYHGGGQALFQNAMKKQGVHALLCGAIPPEASGWYRTPIRTAKDFKGKTIRAFGLGGDVLAKLEVNVERLDAGGILVGFETGRLDGAEYSLPSVDAELGFQKFARQYYFPGWHQPVTLFTLAVNERIWQGLPAYERAAIETICGDNVRHALAEADASQFEALKKLSLDGIQVRRWPDEVLKALETAWKEVAREHATNHQGFAAAWTSLQRFRRDYAIWHEISRF